MSNISSASIPYPGHPVRLLIDAVLILIFIAIGLVSHSEPLADVLATAFPFLLAGLAAHAAVWVVASRRRLPLLLEGFMLWVITLTAGMALRVSFGDTAATAFVIVSAVMLLLFLVGWRLLVLLVAKKKRR